MKLRSSAGRIKGGEVCWRKAEKATQKTSNRWRATSSIANLLFEAICPLYLYLLLLQECLQISINDLNKFYIFISRQQSNPSTKMQLLTFLYPTLLALLLTPSPISAAAPKKVPKNAILLSNVKTLTLRENAKTSHRRVSAIPQ